MAGFTARELLTALAVALTHFQKGKPFFVNCYPRVVTEEGSKEAQRLVDTLMEACDSEWRGLGIIPGSGLRLRDEWGMYDARKKYQVPKMEGRGYHRIPFCGRTQKSYNTCENAGISV